MKTLRLLLANDQLVDSANLILPVANELTVGTDGWALLAPYGDSRYIVHSSAGSREIVQRITRESATAMANAFNGIKAKVKRWGKGAPIFAGHPDQTEYAHLYPDKSVKGLFDRIEARDNGLYFRPIFNEAGAELLSGTQKLYPSGRWAAVQTANKDGVPVFEPVEMISVGITPRPNLPTEMFNATPSGDASKSTGGDNTDTTMERKKLIEGLIAAGILKLSNEATDTEVITAITTLHTQAASATTLTNERTSLANQLAARDTEIATLKQSATAAADSHKKIVGVLLNDRQQLGVITEAERKVWEGRLTTNFANEFPEFEKLKPKMKTEGDPNASGSRRSTGDQGSAAQELVRLANEHVKANGTTYADALDYVCSRNPELKAKAFAAPAK